MIDAHCHILPNIDDSLVIKENFLDTIKVLRQYNISNVVFTPHINSKYNNVQLYKDTYNNYIELINLYNIDAKLSYEINWLSVTDIGFFNLFKYAYPNTNFILLELSTINWPYNLENVLIKLKKIGLEIIIAHPERCIPLYKDVHKIKTLKKIGCFFMLSANFCRKDLIKGIALKSAKKMLKLHIVDAICSDAHCAEDYQLLKKAYEIAAKYKFDVYQNDKFLKESIFNEI